MSDGRIIKDSVGKRENGYPEIIEKFRSVPGGAVDVSRAYEILPDGYFDLAFLLAESDCKVFLAGPYTEKTSVPIGGYEVFIVRFRVGRLPDLADIRPSDLVDTMVELPRVFGLDAGALCERLITELDVSARQNFIGELLCRTELSGLANDEIYVRATSLIEACEGQVKIAELAHTLGVSSRMLERKFKATLGIPPKKFIRIVRFQKVVAQLRSGQDASKLIDIAHEFGYTDQSHFIRDFKDLSGAVPGSF